jgi:hypothetical protein
VLKKLALGVILSAAFVNGYAAEKALEGSTFYLGPDWNYLNSNWGNGTKQTGSLWGVLGGYTYVKPDFLYVNAEFNYMAGILKGTAGNDPTQEYITQIRLGYNMVSPLYSLFTITPFLGIGSYIFNQTLGGDQVFNSQFWYVPIGVSFDVKVEENWKIGLMVSGSPTFAGRWKIDEWKEAPVTVLWKGELPVSYTGISPFALSFIPFIKGWAYCHKGDLTKQRNSYYGCKLLASYSF